MYVVKFFIVSIVYTAQEGLYHYYCYVVIVTLNCIVMVSHKSQLGLTILLEVT